MKPKDIFFLCLVAALSIQAGTAHAMILTVQDVTANPGETVRVNLTLNTTPACFQRLNFTLDFSPESPADAPSLKVNDDANGFHIIGGASHKIEPNRIEASLGGGGSCYNGGSVMSVPFTVPTNAPLGAKYRLQITEVNALDQSFNPANVTVQNGSLQVATVKRAAGIAAIDSSGVAGGTATVTLMATPALSRLWEVQFTLQYDPKLGFSKSDIQPGPFPVTASNLNTDLSSPGTIKFDIWTGKYYGSDIAAQDGPVALARVTFHLPPAAAVGKTYPLHLSGINVLVFNGRTASYNIVPGIDGKITVVKPLSKVRPMVEGGLVSVVPRFNIMNENQEVPVEIRINDKIENVSGATFRLVTDSISSPGAFNLVLDTALTGPLTDGFSLQVNPSFNGETVVGLASSENVSGPGTLMVANLHLSHEHLAGTTFHLELKDLLLSINGEDFSAATEDSLISVNIRSRGDVADQGTDVGDGVINVQDAIDLLRILIGLMTETPSQHTAADVNCDGEITISDVVVLLKKAVGLADICRDPLPVNS
jgi:hypothetical protein